MEFEGERFPKIKEKDGVRFCLLGITRCNGARIAEYMEIPEGPGVVEENRARLGRALNQAAQAMGHSADYELVFPETPPYER